MSCLTAIEMCKPINVLCCVHLQAALGQSNTPAAATSAAAIGTPAAATAAITGTGSASGLVEYDRLLSERLQPFLTAAAAVGGEVSKEAYRFKPQLYPTSFRLCALIAADYINAERKYPRLNSKGVHPAGSLGCKHCSPYRAGYPAVMI